MAGSLSVLLPVAGMIDESLDTEAMASEPKPDEFRSKKPFARLMIMAGGVIFNVILAFIIYTGITLTWGDEGSFIATRSLRG